MPDAPDGQVASDKRFPRLGETLDIIQKLIVVLGLPFAAVGYFEVKKKEQSAREKEQHAREIATYTQMDDRYHAYVSMCLNYPHLDVSDAANSEVTLTNALTPRDKLTSKDKIRERQLMFDLFAMYERAFVLYSDVSTAFRQQQWTGWEVSLTRWFTRDSFREAWEVGGRDYDTEFQKYINARLPPWQKKQ